MTLNLLFVTHYTGLGGGETALVTLAAGLDPARYRPSWRQPACSAAPGCGIC